MKKRGNQSNNNGLGSLWAVTAVLVLLFIAALFYLKHHSTATTHKPAKKITAHKTLPQPQESKVKSKKPQFDFYTILPQSKVGTEVTRKSVTPPPALMPKAEISKPVSSSATKTSTHYLLQVASVKDYKDADSMKAQLTLLGFDVNIQKVKLGNKVMNRVTLGPYNSLHDAQEDQQRLRKNKVNGMLLKLNGKAD
jgi:cell division protein FtsN